jgi:hypothetical protein
MMFMALPEALFIDILLSDTVNMVPTLVDDPLKLFFWLTV